MTLADIRSSGLLELYALGQLDAHDQSEVRAALRRYPELVAELREIEIALYRYAESHGLTPEGDVVEKILRDYPKPPGRSADPSRESITTSENKTASSGRGLRGLLSGLFLAAIAGIGVYAWQQSELSEARASHQLELEECDTKTATAQAYAAQLESVFTDQYRPVDISATEAYASARIELLDDQASNQNYLRVIDLPELAEGETFQLWSITGDNAPVPMDLFDEKGNGLIAVGKVNATDAYAISIEPAGGSTSPNMDKLVGVFAMAG